MDFVSSVDTAYGVVSSQWLHDQLVDFATQYGHLRVGDRFDNAARTYNVHAPMCIDVNCTLRNPSPDNRYWFRVAPEDYWYWESRSYSTWQSEEPHVFEESGECETEIEVLARFETFLSWRLLPADRPAVPGVALDRGFNLGLVHDLLASAGVPRIRPRERRDDRGPVPEPQPIDKSGADLLQLIASATGPAAGAAGAHSYHRGIALVLPQLFRPHLVDFTVEQEIDHGIKRIDIVAVNAAKEGFFDWLRLNFPPAPYVLIECKNGTVDPSNPELDQLLGRFSSQRGHFGLLMCRAVLDIDRLMLRCREAFRDGRGAIIPITDADLITLARQQAEEGDYALLRERFRQLTM